MAHLTAYASAVVAASAVAAATPGRHESSERALAYTYVNGDSIVKTYGAVFESPALRGAIAWATRRAGRQVEFSGRSNRAIGFEQI